MKTTTTRTITVSSRRGPITVESPYGDNEVGQALIEAVEAGRVTGSFGSDLARSWRSGRGLSEKQLAWAHVLIAQASAPEPASCASFPAIAGLLRDGAVRITLPVGRANATGRVTLRVAGVQSRNPGTVHVTDGGPFGENEYYGRMDPDTGALQSHRPLPPAVEAALSAIEVEPRAYLSAAGLVTGTCCFCSRELTTSESRGAGYGPVCAKRHGLPWGAETRAQEASMSELTPEQRALLS